ncbi:DNA-directed RNA polymerase I subunit RPA34.5-domain-containing protein [Cristinia sonorae]|uniref:DNA-directed RNA polymerase I subunit RPA34.5-domain-containing protein n=1 Tax=Cristinia sonorae TaxID=1940300 RepID=A0A8K0UNS7_9AGAR|nr:DNA-directed RNA polymerase I subunit RPA34.5-domain-containing protein [Cristinia sonorae]
MSSTTAGPSKKKSSTKKSSASKQKEKRATEVTSEPRNEGTNPKWNYEPPKGAVLANHDVDPEEFDYDALKGDDNLELWIIRVPKGVKPKHLEKLKVDPPSSALTGSIGTLSNRDTQYDVWCLGNGDNDRVGGEELKNLTCLVPRQKKGGKLYAVPTMTTRHLVVSARAALPTPPHSSDGDDSESSVTYTNPPRPSYPVEALKHRFMPIGSLSHTADDDVEDHMEVDEAPVESAPASAEPAKKEKKTKGKKEDATGGEVKPAKRKKEEEPMKKQKKVKADSS